MDANPSPNPPATSARSALWPWVVAVIALLPVLLIAWNRVQPDPERLWIDAQSALRARQLPRAEANLTSLHRLRPPTTRDLLLEAQIAIARDHTDQALEILRKIPLNDPLAAQAFLLAGRLERDRKRLRPAEAHLRRALVADPSLVDAHKELIYILGIQSRRHEVDAEFHALAELTPLTHHDLFTWALTHFTEWRPDVAKDLQSFIKADPDDRFSRVALAEVLADEVDSEADLDDALSGLPSSDPDATAARARFAIAKGRLEDAETLLQNSPSHTPALDRLRGRLAMHNRQTEAAVSYYRNALSREPYDRVSNFELGQALSLQGDKANAAILLDRSKRLNDVYNLVIQIRSADRENQPPDLIRLARALEAASLNDEARQWFTLAVKRSPLNAEAQQGLHRLKPTPPKK